MPLPELPGFAPDRERRLVEDILLALPRPETPVDEIVVGPMMTGVRAGERAGLGAMLGARLTDEETDRVGALQGQPLGLVAELALEESPGLRCVGMAAANAGLRLREPGPDVGGEDLLARLGMCGKVVLVGDFPFAERLADAIAPGTLSILELKDGQGFAAPETWSDLLAEADVVGITATALLTGAMAWFLGRARKAYRVVLGPTTPFAPALFTAGADVLAGSLIEDWETVRSSIADGLSFKALKKRGGVRFAALLRPGG
jgi:uncharacterized protein (DUF4213/DUF364 family)